MRTRRVVPFWKLIRSSHVLFSAGTMVEPLTVPYWPALISALTIPVVLRYIWLSVNVST
jgi:hypothetical protein